MTVKALHKSRFLTRKNHLADRKRERREPFQLQEQYSGAIPLRTERPAAELLAERWPSPILTAPARFSFLELEELACTAIVFHPP